MLTDRQIKLVVGSLLHDIGKVVYRSGDGRNHSTSGYDFLKNEAKIVDEAKEEAARIIQRANEEAELSKKRAMDEVKQEMITVASMMAAKVVAANIDATVQDTLVEETLKEMGESTWQS